MTFTKLAARAAAALTMVAFAAPALPCGDQQTHATFQPAPAAPTAAPAAPSATPKDAIAKQGSADRAKGAKKAASGKKATATN